MFRLLLMILTIFLCSCDVEEIMGPGGQWWEEPSSGCMDPEAKNYCSYCTTDDCESLQCTCVY